MKKIFKIILAVIALGTVVTTISYAWYTNLVSVQPGEDILNSNAAYYAGGDGTRNNPFQIANARHLYNFSWLQDLGYYDSDKDSDPNTSGNQPFYFELVQDIDMSDLRKNGVQSPIPAIGIDAHPFLGSFDGNNHVIKNLYISTSFNNNNYIKPTSTVLNASSGTMSDSGNQSIATTYNGFFGYIGTTNLNSSAGEGMGIQNFILDTTIIECSKNVLAGVIAGYVNANILNIGVHNSKIKLTTGVTGKLNNEISKYTLIGDYNETQTTGVGWETKPGGDVGFGASIDIKGLYHTLGGTDVAYNKNSGTGKTVIPSDYAVPLIPKSQTIITPTNSSYSMTVAGNNGKNVKTATTQEAADTNVGYYASNGDIEIRYEPNVFSYTNFYSDGNQNGENQPVLSGDAAPEEKIQNYLNENGDYLLVITKTNQPDFNNEGGYLVVENGRIGDYTGKVLIPRGGISVLPYEPGTFQFVVGSDGGRDGGQGFAGFRVYRAQRKTPGDYSTSIGNYSSILEKNAMLRYGRAYYYTLTITQADIDAGYEYFVSGGDGYFPAISYIDIGTNGGGSTLTPSYKSTIDGIDFVYRINDGYSEITSEYLSNVLLNLTGTSPSNEYIMIFNRTNKVYYYIPTNAIVVTPSGDGESEQASSDPSD